ncbi:MAG: hypothetical protein KAV00_13940 [Phycisphaerae bacterium]|nr:hypothetical protein [Phycisphaerae bacterium]
MKRGTCRGWVTEGDIRNIENGRSSGLPLDKRDSRVKPTSGLTYTCENK